MNTCACFDCEEAALNKHSDHLRVSGKLSPNNVVDEVWKIESIFSLQKLFKRGFFLALFLLSNVIPLQALSNLYLGLDGKPAPPLVLCASASSASLWQQRAEP